MNFLSNINKKYLAAVVTAFAAIAIPAQATDCTTICQNAAVAAAQAAANQAAQQAQADCMRQTGGGIYMTMCMNSKTAQITAAGDAAYYSTLNSCMGSCY